MFRFITVAMALWLFSGTSLAAGQQTTQAKQPAHASAPAAPSKPVDVNVLSLPPAVPAEVKVSNFPSADPAGGRLVTSTNKLVIATWALGLVTLFTAAVALVIAGAQGRETTRRDRDSMMREISRAATKVYATGRRVSDLSILALATVSGMTDMPGVVESGELAKAQETFIARDNMLPSLVASPRVAVEMSQRLATLPRLSDSELRARLWEIDSAQIELDAMQEQIASELEDYEKRIAAHRQWLAGLTRPA